MPRTSTRQLSSMLDLISVDAAAVGPNVSDNIQLVYIVDDIRHLTTPVPPIDGYITTTAAASIPRVSGIAMRSPPGSTIAITWMRNDSATDSIYIVGDAITITDDIVAGVIDFSTGGTPATSFIQGSRALSTAGVQLPAGENIPDRHPNLIVAPGQIFCWHGLAVNTAMVLTWSFREVPTP